MLKPGEKRIGYLYNFKAATVPSESGAPESALFLYFIDKYGKSFSSFYRFHPYFLVDFSEDIGSSGVDGAVNTLKIRFPQASSSMRMILDSGAEQHGQIAQLNALQPAEVDRSSCGGT